MSEKEEDKSEAKKDESKKEEDDEEELPMTDVTDPRETDVLCGRGGAALRHPGNQTYRRLVNLNKQLYITCLKTEKLKISRSIVAAIREQKGRFLERDAKKGSWYDIGDKKAIEKTSQALREGQPKLRQKMIDSGQIPPDHDGVSMQHQFGNGIYNARAPPAGMNQAAFQDPSYGMLHMAQPPMQPSNNVSGDMPPPPARNSSNISNDMSSEALMSRLSLTSNPTSNAQSIPSWTPSTGSSVYDEARSIRSRLRPSLQPRGSGVASELGVQSAMSIMSDFSAYGGAAGMDPTQMMMGDNRVNIEFEIGMDPHTQLQLQQQQQAMHLLQQQQQQQQQQQFAMGNTGDMGAPPPPPPPPPMSPYLSPMMSSPSVRSFDRRRMFAKTKYSKPSSGTQHSGRSSDGMPDIHMVESNLSLMSNLSSHGSKHADALSNMSDHHMKDEIPKDSLGVGSRRSLMSGLSKISDTSVHSVFSDLSKKIGNVSTRSIAMSEVSGIEEGFAEDIEETFSFDAIVPSPKI